MIASDRRLLAAAASLAAVGIAALGVTAVSSADDTGVPTASTSTLAPVVTEAHEPASTVATTTVVTVPLTTIPASTTTAAMTTTTTTKVPDNCSDKIAIDVVIQQVFGGGDLSTVLENLLEDADWPTSLGANLEDAIKVWIVERVEGAVNSQNCVGPSDSGLSEAQRNEICVNEEMINDLISRLDPDWVMPPDFCAAANNTSGTNNTIATRTGGGTGTGTGSGTSNTIGTGTGSGTNNTVGTGTGSGTGSGTETGTETDETETSDPIDDTITTEGPG